MMRYTAAMENTPPGPNPPQTVGEALQYCAESLERSDVFFGHGTDNPWDEAVQLVLSVADLPLDSDDGVLPHRLDEQASPTLHCGRAIWRWS